MVPMNGIKRTQWVPILEGREAAAVWEAIEGIACALDNPGEFRNHEHTLIDGRPGPALFLAYLAMAAEDDALRQRSIGFIEQAVDGLEGAETDVSIMTGFTGVAWAVEHLQGRACDPTDGDLNEDIDETILTILRRRPAEKGWPTGHDVMFGLAGVGVYALERLPRPSAAAILGRVIERLDQMAERSEEGLTWSSTSSNLSPKLRATYPDGYYSLGVAHGVPGMIGFLGMVYAAGVEQPRIRR